MMTVILSSNYLPNIQWMQYLIYEDSFIDIHEYYLKQSYRNRTEILSANGLMSLTIPVQKISSKQPMSEIMMQTDINWKRQHIESIKAAYGSAPYFPYYFFELKEIFDSQTTNLTIFQKLLLEWVLKKMKVDIQPRFTTCYQSKHEQIVDMRNVITPKIKSNQTFKPYMQVFNEKFGFMANLSVLDVLMNCGPSTKNYL